MGLPSAQGEDEFSTSVKTARNLELFEERKQTENTLKISFNVFGHAGLLVFSDIVM